jgi:hypothetical protein
MLTVTAEVEPDIQLSGPELTFQLNRPESRQVVLGEGRATGFRVQKVSTTSSAFRASLDDSRRRVTVEYVPTGELDLGTEHQLRISSDAPHKPQLTLPIRVTR